ncbi:MAG: CDP-diacylglycerol--serine O-phosphatidyltransferase [Clostridiaceae bacterium]|nr:CDP-diacylglycerol--serine O-phosphatidyltransferase [Clostridiaceae bacterium]
MKAKSAVPNIFTFSNLGFGIMAIMMTLNASLDNPINYRLACIFVLAAGFADRYDGRIARYLNVSSELGKELDSLADLVSFGVAPSIIVFSMYNLANFGIMGYLVVLVFPIAGAYRLARYNCSSFDGNFVGVPITIAGTFMALYCLLTVNHFSNPILPILFIFILSYLMVGKFKFKKV